MKLKKQYEFIAENIHFLDEYTTRDLFHKLYAKKFRSATDIYLDDNGKLDGVTIVVTDKARGYSTTKNWEVDFEKTIEQNVADLTAILISRGITMKEFMVWLEVRSIYRSYYLRRSEKSFTMHHNGTASLVYLLRYLTTGKCDENLKESHDFMEANNIRYNTGAYEFTLSNIKVKLFMNGRLDIKGLTPEQEKQIDRFAEIYKAVERRG